MGGGGGGGYDGAGGGGGGGVSYASSVEVTAGINYTVIVGAGDKSISIVMMMDDDGFIGVFNLRTKASLSSNLLLFRRRW